MPRTRSLAWSELKIGVLTIVAILVAAVTVFTVMGSRGFFWQRFSLKTRLPDVTGLKGGSPVRVSGMEVGSVNRVVFSGDQLEVEFEVNKDVGPRITDKSAATLGSVSLLGLGALDITAASNGTPIPEGGYVPTGKTAPSLSNVTAGASEGIGELTGLLRDMRAGEGTAGKFVTDPALYNQLKSLADRLDLLTKSLNDGQGTIGQLLKDRKLYENMNAAVNDVRDLVAAIKKDPKRYLNVRVSIF